MHDSAVITWLTDPEASDLARSGGKGANLAAMARAGLPVPEGFVVSTAAYRHNAGEHGLDAMIRREITAVDEDDPDAVEAVSARLRQAFETAPVPAPLREQITAAYRAMGEPAVAVRSSATAEDLPEASFAGQQDTVLDVTGAAALCAAVRRCWSSLWTPRAIAYRRHHGIGHERLAVAVVVQRMVPAESAGVLFTADPVTGRRDRIVVEASAGLGDAVVGGRVTPDRWVIDASTRRALSGPEAGGILGAAVLDDLADLGLQAAALSGSPQDVEWAIARGRCWLLQSRPITSLFPLPVPPPTAPELRVYIPATLVAQGFAEPMTAAGNAFLRSLAAGWIRFFTSGSRMRGDDAPPPWLPVVGERLFVDITPLLQRPRLASRMLAGLGAKDPVAGTALREWLDAHAGRLSRPRSRVPVRALTAWAPTLLGEIVTSVAAPARDRRRLLARTEQALARLERESAALSTPLEQVAFVAGPLPARTTELVTAELAPVYAEQLTLLAAQWLVRRWLGSSSALEPLRRWLPHDPTVAMGLELARLAREYRTRPGLTPAASDPGVQAFLRRFGHRAPDREIDLGLPRLDENPAYVVELIRSYQHAAGGDPLARSEAGQADARATATALVARARQVKGPLRAATLRVLLTRIRVLGGLREQPKFDMVRAIALGRRTLLRAGTTLVADGLLDAADDVFFLDTRQLHAILAGAPGDLRPLAAAGRRAFERELHRRAVPRILVSDGETVYESESPEGRAALVATPVSPGVHEGVVRVLDSPVGSGLQPGEVLVAATTDPGWTPLFPIAGALVMEVGGVVSHGAVVAREYGIPAVAGIAEATTRLRTGQRVRVDGGNGTVTVLEPDGAALVAVKTSEHAG